MKAIMLKDKKVFIILNLLMDKCPIKQLLSY
jgi:hypothetical protein